MKTNDKTNWLSDTVRKFVERIDVITRDSETADAVKLRKLLLELWSIGKAFTTEIWDDQRDAHVDKRHSSCTRLIMRIEASYSKVSYRLALKLKEESNEKND